MESAAFSSLEHPFAEEEVKVAVCNYDGCKTHRPDGFSLAFLKIHWDLLKEDTLKFVADFNSKVILTRACTSSFITLILEVMNPQSLSEYQPICLVRSLHKILSKLLTGRIKEVIESLNSIKQNAFIKNRNILDGVLMVNEAMHLAKR